MASRYDFSFMRAELGSIEAAAYFDRVVGEYFSWLMTRRGGVNLIHNLRSCFESISRTYRQGLRGTGSRPDWDDVGNRCTYVYRFFAMHSWMVYQSLKLALEGMPHITRTWRNQWAFRVCCIGGGPGSDVAGLTKFLRDTGLVPTNRLECTIFDKYYAWATTWQEIQQSNPGEFPSIRYAHGSLTTPGRNHLLTWSHHVVSEADIITFVKVFSTVVAFNRSDPTRGDLLREIFRALSPGALVLYIDNRYADQHGEFRRLACAGGVTELLYEWHGEMKMPFSRGSFDMRSIKRRAGFEPLDRCTVSVMLLRKPHPQLYRPYYKRPTWL